MGWIADRLRSFGPALRGGVDLIGSQGNARIHLAATVVVVAVAFAVGGLSRWEWLFLVSAVAGVWMAEAVNTAVEALADRLTGERDPLIRRAKDCAAFAVLVASAYAVVVAALLVFPRLAGASG